MASNLAAVQMDCIVGDIKQNTTQAIRLLENLLKKEPDIALAVFPEMALYGYDRFQDLKQKYTQEDINHALTKIAAVCKKNQVEVIIGAPYYHTSCIENALYYISDAGAIQKVYSKIHLVEVEQNCFQPGDTYSILKTRLGKVGLLICWDSAFGEPARLYAKSGADFLIVSAAWEAQSVAEALTTPFRF
jgi:predicted amidohydrolase